MNSSYEDHIHRLIEWHMSDVTGSQYWTKRRESGWTKEVVERWFLEGRPPKNHRDLEHDLRSLPIESFIPQSIRKKDIVGVFESGGTTGAPKRVALGRSWMRELLEWSAGKMVDQGHTPGRNWLVAVPTGPHVVGELAVNAAYRENALAFRIDIDPRWAKNADKYKGTVGDYLAHLVHQIRTILTTQNVGCLVTTPPILLALARDHELIETLNKERVTVRWGGLFLDDQSRSFLKSTIFPNNPFFGVLGNTMTLGFGIETSGQNDNIDSAFEFHSPVNKIFHYDAGQDRFFPTGQGILAYSHASETHLYPPTPDRDTGQIDDRQNVLLENPSPRSEETFHGVY